MAKNATCVEPGCAHSRMIDRKGRTKTRCVEHQRAYWRDKTKPLEQRELPAQRLAHAAALQQQPEAPVLKEVKVLLVDYVQGLAFQMTAQITRAVAIEDLPKGDLMPNTEIVMRHLGYVVAERRQP